MGCRQVVLLVFGFAVCLFIGRIGFAQPDDYSGVVAEEEWTVLHLKSARMKGTRPLPKLSKLSTLEEFDLTGPQPGHPFVLGNFSTDGKFGLVDGYVQRLDGHDAALRVCWADEFELEGIMEHAGYGGWFFLMGWDQGHGYGVSNVNMKVSGSPWFVSEFRGAKAIEGKTTELDDFDWKREEPFRLTVKDKHVVLEIGRFEVVDFPLENYKPGEVIFGVYETQYGTKPIRVKSLRVRAISSQ
ncbi:hypothetical protein KOR42_28820 [Thalassoglobus neptunius]|uniref:3-keto-disaccharide hydrolase domain-containing protein n=1 Tax=Thalassoglobus neptunius TaxID=1938619 RepID=A0A5C5WZA5_9PLAN|nr:hypothetical protein [Thalassoglobus neptunius]TWT55255.1 hypothetical protein KOR42_28820 [Thalassoglobus neptunius]